MPRNSIPPHFITAYEAAERMAYHPDWMKVRIRAGEIPSAVKGPQNAWFLDPADLLLISSGKGLDFWAKVDKGPSCWLWTGALQKGYGIHGGRLAHRLAYEELVGAIPDGLTLDHLCREPRCVRPEHLEPVSRAENTRRAFALKTHCKHGHEFTPENTARNPQGARVCRRCSSLRQQAYQRQRKGQTSSVTS